jgi:hypothetical protein
MARKPLAFLEATVVDGTVRLTFGKSTPLFTEDRGESYAVRISRSAEPDFTFGQDYLEYFDAVPDDDAVVLHQGPLDAADGRRFTFVDKSVVTGQTYVYWVAPASGGPATGPVAVRVRDPEVWWSEAELRRRLAALACDGGDRVVVDSAGSTTMGRDLPQLTVGSRDRCVALVGAVHPGESGPELIVGALERLLSRDPQLLDCVGIVAIPSLGLDERQRQVEGHPPYLRRNHNQVDVNRNFPGRWDEVDHSYGEATDTPASATYRGPAPASERETQAVIRLVCAARPDAVLSFHCLAGICGPEMLTSRHAAGDQEYTERCWQISRAYSGGFYKSNGAERARLEHLCSAGSLATWLYEEHRIPAFDLEGDDRPESRASWHDEATSELVEEYQERHYRGLRALLTLLR